MGLQKGELVENSVLRKSRTTELNGSNDGTNQHTSFPRSGVGMLWSELVHDINYTPQDPTTKEFLVVRTEGKQKVKHGFNAPRSHAPAWECIGANNG